MLTRNPACSRIALFATLCLSHAANARQSADELLSEGRFAEARDAYRVLSRSDPGGAAALVRLAQLALMAGEPERAMVLTETPQPEAGDEQRRLVFRQRAIERLHRFAEAAEIAEARGRDARAAQLRSFGESEPYRIEMNGDRVEVPFVRTDPLPVVALTIGGTREINCIIDTGGDELILDPELADEFGLPRFGSKEGMFAGGKRAQVEYSSLDRVGLGGATVHDIPVSLLPSKGMGRIFGGLEISGVLGTTLLSKFRATIDYAGGRLVLERRGTERERTDGETVVPMWLGASHLVLAKGNAGAPEDAGPFVWFIDTGLAANGFLAGETVLERLGIDLEGKPSFQGAGGGGPVTVTPFVTPSLSVGSFRRENVPSLFGAFPEELDDALGFPIHGIVSHAFFRTGALTLDFDAMELIITPGGLGAE